MQISPCTLCAKSTLHAHTHVHTSAHPYTCIEPCASTSMCATLCLCTPTCKHHLAHPYVCFTRALLHHPCTPHDRTHVCKSTITHSTCIRVPPPLHTRVQTLPWPPPSADACNPVVQCFAHSHACKCACTAAHPRAKHPCAFPRSPSLHTHVHKSIP